MHDALTCIRFVHKLQNVLCFALILAILGPACNNNACCISRQGRQARLQLLHLYLGSALLRSDAFGLALGYNDVPCDHEECGDPGENSGISFTTTQAREQ
jgi:hypothetical protein